MKLVHLLPDAISDDIEGVQTERTCKKQNIYFHKITIKVLSL